MKIIVVVGPTATGKTDFSIGLAQKLNGEVISADSRQVYTGLNLGSGKVTKKEMQGIPHYLIDVTSPKKQFSVAQYTKLADKAIVDILSRGKTPIVCGGTGFYIDALIEGTVLPEVAPNKELRKKLAGLTAEKLFAKLIKLDPERAETIDKRNPVRLIRAIEIATALGKVPKTKKNTKYEAVYFGLDIPDDVLKKKIHDRLLARMKLGMLHEVKKLRTEGVSWKRLYDFGLEYRYLGLHLQGKLTKEEMLSELEAAIWQYAKRQRTWFKRNKNITWLDPRKKSSLKEALSILRTTER